MELYHHGIPGQKWGVRRYQNKDGSLTSAGKQRYSSLSGTSNTSSKKATSDRVETSSGSNGKKGISKETAVKIAIGSAAALTLTAAAVYAAKNPDKVKGAIDSIKNRKMGSLSDEQYNYIMKNVANIPSHIDRTSSIRKTSKYEHAYLSTLKSRNDSIRGDRKLYGEKYAEGRDPVKEAKGFVENANFYKIHRGGVWG